MSKTYVCLWHSQYKHDMTKKPSQSLEGIFFLLFPHFCTILIWRRKNPGFYLFSMYPGALARTYKIIKEGLIKGKVYTESSRISVQLPPPMFSVHCASYDHQIHKRFCPEKRTFFAPLYNYPTSWNIQFVQVHPARTYPILVHRKLSWK